MLRSLCIVYFGVLILSKVGATLEKEKGISTIADISIKLSLLNLKCGY